MSVKLDRKAFEHAKKLINEGRAAVDDRDEWSEHQPSAQQENRYLEKHGFGEDGKWYLGIADDADEDNKGRYKFPYGDFDKVHRCGVLAAEVRAAQHKHADIENAAAHLHGMLDSLKSAKG